MPPCRNALSLALQIPTSHISLTWIRRMERERGRERGRDRPSTTSRTTTNSAGNHITKRELRIGRSRGIAARKGRGKIRPAARAARWVTWQFTHISHPNTYAHTHVRPFERNKNKNKKPLPRLTGLGCHVDHLLFDIPSVHTFSTNPGANTPIGLDGGPGRVGLPTATNAS